MTNRGIWLWVGVLVCWGAAFSVSCRIHARPADPSTASAGSVAGALMGEMRTAFSGQFYETADLYFHRGVEHTKERALAGTMLQRAAEQISPRSHVHVSGQGVREIMPWLWMSIRANPHSISPYLVASFWLATDAERPDVALSVLDQGLWHNPGSSQILVEKGRILLSQGKQEQALRTFDTALAFWPGSNGPDSEDARRGKAAALLYRSLLHEAAGRKKEAIRDLQAHLLLFPDRAELARRVEDHKNGVAPSRLASELLADILTKHGPPED